MSAYPGIDYGMGQSNRDIETGIRYGVISCHSMGEGFYDAQEPDYGDATCPKCGNALLTSDDDSIDQEADWYKGKDFACVTCERSFWSDQAFSDEALGWSIDDGEYKVIDCLDNDAMIIKSPYYTYAQFCSPCVPGAGNLDNPVPMIDGGAKSYCFGHEWFEGNKAPYPVYAVADDSEVLPDEVQS